MKIYSAAPLAALLLAACADQHHTPVTPETSLQVESNSPHGGGTPRSILFRSLRTDPGPGLYTMNPNGSDPIRIPGSTAADLFPDWSPSGQKISFVSRRITGDAEVWIMSPDGTDPEPLTASPGVDGGARWSPNGQQIAFHSMRDGNFEIYVMNADGSGERRVTQYTLPDMLPSWSPDGMHIVFDRNIGGRSEVHVIDADASEANGAAPTRLTFTGGDQAAFSPNGRQIAFVTNRDGYRAIYVMSADGSDPTNLTPKPEGVTPGQWFHAFPRWSKDGQQIYFHGVRPSSAPDIELFVMNAGGGGATRLTTSPGLDVTPVPR